MRSGQRIGGADAAHRGPAAGTFDQRSCFSRADIGKNTIMTLKDRGALVRGASRGIGKPIARELARQGASVAATATSDAGADGIRQYLAAEGLAGTGAVMNVNNAQQVESAVAAVQGQLGDISILVNNAGITRDNLLVRMKDEEWDEIMATDLNSDR